jgi:hypothetical protein
MAKQFPTFMPERNSGRAHKRIIRGMSASRIINFPSWMVWVTLAKG